MLFRASSFVLVLLGLTSFAAAADPASPFDGTLKRWTTPDGKPAPAGWEVVDGAIHLSKAKNAPKAGTIVTADDFGDFDLSFEFKIAPKGNSGIKYRVRNYDGKVLGLEYQIYDDEGAKKALAPKNQTGSIYDLFEPDAKKKKLKPAGEYNSARIIVRNDKIEHWLNGERIVAVAVGDAEWKKRIAQSKFNDAGNFSLNQFGKLMLTDHGAEVWYRNFRFEQFPTAAKPEPPLPPKKPPVKKPEPKKPEVKKPASTQPDPKTPSPRKPEPKSTPPATKKEPPKVAAPQIDKRTVVFKKVDGVEVRADVYRGPEQAKRPVVVWIHGGALINGHRESVPAWLLNGLLPRGYAIVSIDYRLAPETKLPAILDDVEDALIWIRSFGPTLFEADPRKIAVVGGSAGGYLTLVTGYRCEPRPTALVSLWGYGDLGADWTFAKSKFPRHQNDKFADDDAKALANLPPVSDSRERKADGGGYYQWLRRSGGWAEAVTGLNPLQRAARFLPFMPERNVTAEFPPTLLIHGDADTDVPVESSLHMAAEFERAKVPHRLLVLKGAEHGLAGSDERAIAEAYKTAIDFLIERLESK